MAKIRLQYQAGDPRTRALDENGNQVEMYLPEAAGGDTSGFRPMQMLIVGLAGCAAVDVLAILRKKRQSFSRMDMEIDAEREPGVEPSLWIEANLVFRFQGDVEREKAEYAVKLSMDKYCSVTETLRRAGANISWRVEVD